MSVHISNLDPGLDITNALAAFEDDQFVLLFDSAFSTGNAMHVTQFLQLILSRLLDLTTQSLDRIHWIWSVNGSHPFP